MSSFRGQDHIDPDDPELDYTPRQLSDERAAKLGPTVSQGARSEPNRSFPMSRPVAPKAINEPARRTGDSQRQAALLGVATRVAAVAGVVAVVALLFVVIKPAVRQLVASSTSSDTTGSTTPPSNQRDVESKPPLAELKAPVVSTPSQPATHEQSEELLQRFLQWREKSNTAQPQ